MQNNSEFSFKVISYIKKCSVGFLLIFLLPIFFGFLGIRPIATPDEARYVEIPREMIAKSDWIVPYLNGFIYFEKPPFVYWIIALFLKIFSLNEYFLRLPIAILSFVTVISQYFFVKKYENHTIAIISTFIISSSILWVFLSQMIILDMPLACLTTLSLFCYYHSLQQTKVNALYAWSALGSILCGLTLLTKGLVGLAFIGMIGILWATFSKEWRKISPLYLLIQLLIILAVALPWHFAVAHRHPDFWHKYFYIEHFARYTTSYHRRYQPFWFFAPIVLLGFIPWIGPLLGSLYHAGKEKFKDYQSNVTSLQIFLYCWAGFTFFFFSFSSSKLIPYILPLFPPLSIIVAKYLYHLISTEKSKYISMMFGIPSVFLAIAFFITGIKYHQLNLTLSDINDIPLGYLWIFSGLFFTLFLCSFAFKQHFFKTSFVFFLAWMYGFHFTVFKVAATVQKPSMQSLCKHLQQSSSKDDHVWMYTVYFQDIPLYLNKNVKIIDYLGELEYGVHANTSQNWVLNSHQWKNILSKTDFTQNQTHWIFTKESKILDLVQNFPFLQLIDKKCEQNFCLIKAIRSKTAQIN